MDQGFFIAKKLENGSPGRPVGNDDGAIMVFEDLRPAQVIRDRLKAEHGDLSIFMMNVVFAGEVLEVAGQ